MRRRDLSKVLFVGAVAAVPAVANGAAARATCTAPCYPATPVEGDTVRSSMYPPGDVRRYGADPAGQTDSTAALKNAIGTGYSLFFPDGVFLTTGNLSPRSGTTWTGTGVLKATADATVLVTLLDIDDFDFALDTDMTSATSDYKVAVAADGSTNFTIRDGRHRDGTIAIGGSTGCSHFVVRGNALIKARAGNLTHVGAIQVNATSHDFEISSNRITEATGAGITIYNRSYQAIIAKNSCTGCLGNGIFVNSGRYLLIEGNICNDNQQSGIGLNTSTPDIFGYPMQCSIMGNLCCGNVYDGIDYNLAGYNRYSTLTIISGNVLSDNGTAATGGTGIYLSNADQTTITGNSVARNNLQGIFLNNCLYCNVTGNTVVANGRNAPNTVDGIAIDGSMNNVTGNTCTNTGGPANQRYGIAELGRNNDNNIVGNNLANNASGSFSSATRKRRSKTISRMNFDKL